MIRSGSASACRRPRRRLILSSAYFHFCCTMSSQSTNVRPTDRETVRRWSISATCIAYVAQKSHFIWCTCGGDGVYRRSFRCRKATSQHTSRRRRRPTASSILITHTSSWLTTKRKEVKSTFGQSSSRETSTQVLLTQTLCMFTVRPDASVVAYMLSSCVRLYICPSHAGIVTKRLNLGSCKQRGTPIYFWHQRSLRNSNMVIPTVVPNSHETG